MDKLRSQRRGMVQGELQYKFIYSVIGTLWRKKYGFIDATASAAESVAGEAADGVEASGEAAYKLDTSATSQDLFADAMGEVRHHGTLRFGPGLSQETQVLMKE